MLIHVHGYLSDDFVGRVILIDTDQTVQSLAERLRAWGPDLYPRPVVAAVVSNERGEVLEMTSTLTEAGLEAGDIFRVQVGPR